MSSFLMKTPPSDGEILDDWEQMADSGVSHLGFATSDMHLTDSLFLAFRQKNTKYQNKNT